MLQQIGMKCHFQSPKVHLQNTGQERKCLGPFIMTQRVLETFSNLGSPYLVVADTAQEREKKEFEFEFEVKN